MDIITSRQNPTFKHIRELITDKSHRLQSGQFWVDGVNFVHQAVENKWNIDKLIYVPEAAQTDFKKKVVESVPQSKRLAFSTELYSAFSAKKDIQGVGAVVSMNFHKNQLTQGWGVVLENVSNPGNLGTIMRTCVAFGIKNIYIINPAVDPFNPDTVRASMGAVFFLNIGVFDSIEKVHEELKKNKYLSFGTSLQSDSIDIGHYNIRCSAKDNVLLWFGSEAKGMTAEARKLCQVLLKIPISSHVDSLNLSESVGIVLYEFTKETEIFFHCHPDESRDPSL